MKISIMQPYFYPYLGYFRLLSNVDIFVIYDCVQFPRDGWVHRNRLTDRNGDLTWLKLPLKKAPLTTLISDLAFSTDSNLEMSLQLQKFGILEKLAPKDLDLLLDTNISVIDYLENHLRLVAQKLSFEVQMIRSSTLEIDPQIKGQSRVLEIVKRLGGTQYINSSGGRELYKEEAFHAKGVELKFLSPYEGNRVSVLERLHNESRDALIHEANSL
jgi:hypothetical protein